MGMVDLEQAGVRLHEQVVEHGFGKIEGFLDPREVARLRIAAESTLVRQSVEHRRRYASNGSLCNLADNPEYADLIGRPEVLQLLKAMGARDPRWTSGYLISKPPGGPPLFWHQDWWGWDQDLSYTDEYPQLFFMYYLTDTTPENGCLRVIPGSHRRRHALHDLPKAHDRGLASYQSPDDPAYADHPDQVAVTARAGDLIVGDARLLHSAFANRSSEERPLLTLWYIPNYRFLPEPVQARLYAIYSREELDLEESSERPPVPRDWPALLFEYVRPLEPTNPGAEPSPWRREPDLGRLARSSVA
jgi:ectoine hydroxylase-related dioxygenase (phytanoyl-CoA dioxygenase family)